VYGLLAVCAVLVLATTRGDSGPESRELAGRTSRGAPISITVVDGRLGDFRTKVAAWCPTQRRRIEWPWARGGGQTIQFERDGSRYVVAEEAVNADQKPPTTVLMELRMTLAEDGRSARGKVLGTAVRGPTACQGSVSFTAQ
jgi:hypothetical protein